jgi:hypothetical protein
MWHHVELLWTDVSEECIASIFRVEKCIEFLHDKGITGNVVSKNISQKILILSSKLKDQIIKAPRDYDYYEE